MNAPAAQRERSPRHALRDAGAAPLWALGVTRPRIAARDALTIVTIHRVLPAEQLSASPLPGLCITPALRGAAARGAEACQRECDARAAVLAAHDGAQNAAAALRARFAHALAE